MTEPIGDAVVEALLRRYYAGLAASECSELEQVAVLLTADPEPTTAARAREHVAQCAACRAALELLQRGEGVSAPARIVRLPRARVALAGVTALAAVVVAVLGVTTWRDEQRADGLLAKGAADELVIAVQRGEQRFVATSGDQLRPGDVLGFFYATTTPGFLALVHADADGQTSVVFPAAGTTSAPVVAGAGQPLPDGGVVTPGVGCEYLVAVFSTTRLELDAVRAAVSRAARAARDCAPRVDVAGARSVQVHLIRP